MNTTSNSKGNNTEQNVGMLFARKYTSTTAGQCMGTNCGKMLTSTDKDQALCNTCWDKTFIEEWDPEEEEEECECLADGHCCCDGLCLDANGDCLVDACWDKTFGAPPSKLQTAIEEWNKTRGLLPRANDKDTMVTLFDDVGEKIQREIAYIIGLYCLEENNIVEAKSWFELACEDMMT